MAMPFGFKPVEAQGVVVVTAVAPAASPGTRARVAIGARSGMRKAMYLIL
jgi:hypothetical protein